MDILDLSICAVGTPLPPCLTELFYFQWFTAQHCTELLYFHGLTAKNKKMQDLSSFYGWAVPLASFGEAENRKPAGFGGLFAHISILAVSMR